MEPAMTYFLGGLLITAAAVNLIAAIGILRFPDVYTRMHAASKAGTLGAGLMLVTIAIHSGELDVASKALAGVVFFLLTAPISAHLLARAAYVAGIEPWHGTKVDQLKGHYTDKQGHLTSDDEASK